MDTQDKITYLDTINNSPLPHIPTNTLVNLCIYSIYDSNEPYVLYLLHKLENKLYWPYYAKNILTYSEYLKKLNIQIYKYQGYLERSNEIYIYIKLENNFQYDKEYHKNVNWFVSINEILFPRTCWIYPIDYSVTSLFITNPNSIYVYKNDSRLDIPEVAYYKMENNNKEYNTYIGLEKNTPNGISIYNYDSYDKGIYIRAIVFLYKYIVHDIQRNMITPKERVIDIDKDNYEILSRNVI
jgi:hypothetical protein